MPWYWDKLFHRCQSRNNHFDIWTISLRVYDSQNFGVERPNSWISLTLCPQKATSMKKKQWKCFLVLWKGRRLAHFRAVKKVFPPFLFFYFPASSTSSKHVLCFHHFETSTNCTVFCTLAEKMYLGFLSDILNTFFFLSSHTERILLVEFLLCGRPA